MFFIPVVAFIIVMQYKVILIVLLRMLHRPYKYLKSYTYKILGEQNLLLKVQNFCLYSNCKKIMYLIIYANQA